MHDMVCIDNQLGINLQTGIESDKLNILFSDSHIFGESEAEDCPAGHDCTCPDKMGFMIFGHNKGSKALHPDMASALPVHKVKSEGAWGGDVTVRNVIFEGFANNGKTACRAKQTIF